MHFSRRAFLSTSSTALLTAGLTAAPSVLQSANASSRHLKVEAVAVHNVPYFNSTFKTQYELGVPSRYHVTWKGRKTKDLVCNVRYDARLMSFGEVVILQNDSEFAALDLKRIADDSAGSVQFAIPAHYLTSPAGVFIELPLAATPLYPTENLGSVASHVFTVASDGESVAITTMPDAGIAVSPWGVDVSALWNEVAARPDGSVTSPVPTSLIVTSVGPFATPSGLELVVQTDARLISKTDVQQITYDPSPDPDDPPRTFSVDSIIDAGYVATRVLLDQPLPASERVEIQLLTTYVPSPDQANPLAASVGASHPPAIGAPQRSTRREVQLKPARTNGAG